MSTACCHPTVSPYERPRRWEKLSDAEWAALARLVAARQGPGRPLADPRGRMDAILWVCVTGQPFRALPAELGRPDTVARHFRRLARAGLFTLLLQAVSNRTSFPDLQGMRHWICRLFRRASRIIGIGTATRMARDLGLYSALTRWHPLLPDPFLSELSKRLISSVLDRYEGRWHAAPADLFRTLAGLHRALQGPRRIPKAAEPP